MKKLLTSILILTSTLSYSQEIKLNQLNIDSLNAHILIYMNNVRDSIIDSHEYTTNQRYIKRTGKYITDTIRVTIVTINKLNVDSKLNLAANNQASYMLKINQATHDQSSNYNGIKLDIDTVLPNTIYRGEYFGVDIKSEICQKTPYGYIKNGYFTSFNKLTINQIYKELAKSIIDSYLNSSGHREALLNAKYKHVGISTLYSEDNTRVFNTIVFN